MSDTPEMENEGQVLEAQDGAGGTGAPPVDADVAGGGSSNVPSINIVDEMRDSFRDYSMSVIIGRALPDVRDGLKPVHRRVLYAMYDEGLLSNKKFSKSAGVVGEVLKKYHPHGDTSVYDAMVRLAQPWNMRDPLVQGQGNFGSIDGDPPAAYRYTEARLAKLAEELLRDIQKNTVDFAPNFDGSVDEPTVLPSRVPNLLVNGSEGIAVAMATRIPPHNMGEIITALLALIAERYEGGEELTLDRLVEIVPGPDFPTGGSIMGQDGVRQAFATGRGSVKMRGRARIEDNEKINRTQIIIDEIPFQVNKAKLVERIADLVREKKIEGIAGLRDESDRDGMRIAVDLKRDAVGGVVLNQLFRHTPLQTSYPVNMVCIDGGQPRTLGLREMLERFLDFRREVVTRRTRYELDEAQARFHTVAGLLTALDDIDRIIDIIRSSRTSEEARQRLCEEKFENAVKIALFADAPTDQIETWLAQGYAQLDESQAQDILDMRLSKLVGLERDKLVAEGEELLKLIARLKEILGDLLVLMGVIKGELQEIKDKFATPRRTQIEGAVTKFSLEDLIAEEDMVVTISHGGYIKRSALANYRAQRRGGRGKSAGKTKDEDFLKDAFVASTHAYLLIFTNLGRVYWLKVHQLPEAGAQARGRPIINLVQLGEGESVVSIVPVRRFPESEGERYVMTVSRYGKVKKSDLKLYSKPRAVGLHACGIMEGDSLLTAKLTDGSNQILLSTRHGMAVRFTEDQIRPMGRGAKGVRGVNLGPADELVSMVVLEQGTDVLCVTDNGFGKRTPAEEYRLIRRGGKGVRAIKLSQRNGLLADVIQVRDDDELMVLTDKGTLIRTPAAGVSTSGRNAQGVKIINVGKDERVMSVSRIADADDAEANSSDTPQNALRGEEGAEVEDAEGVDDPSDADNTADAEGVEPTTDADDATDGDA